MLTETLNLPSLLHSLRERLAGALAGLPEHTGLVSVTLAMPELNGLRFSATDEMAVYWARPGEQQYLATSGTAVRLTACGGDRFLHLEQKFQHHLKSWLQQDPEKVGGGARAFLGFAFEARCGDRQSASAELFVPTVLLEQDGSTSRFVFTCYRPGSGPTVDAVPDWLQYAQYLLRAFELKPEPSAPAQRIQRTGVEPADKEWLRRVGQVRTAIRSGRLRKLVLTRQMRVVGHRPLLVPGLMAWLESHYPDCAHFAHRSENGTLVGASPERLACLKGRAVVCDAVAGTAIRVPDDSFDHGLGEALLNDAKSLQEHELVVRDIERALVPLCNSVSVPPEPQLMTLPALRHLWSPIHARLSEDASLLQLIHALHPTPAVGGVPRAEAIDWLTRLGDQRHDWYTGGMGWITPQGDGEVSVVLRCATLRGREATLYAGAGIVADSHPEIELSETEWKLRTLLDALVAS